MPREPFDRLRVNGAAVVPSPAHPAPFGLSLSKPLHAARALRQAQGERGGSGAEPG